MSTIEVTEQQHLTVVKHLAGGKSLDLVASIMKLPRSVVLDIGSKHGYPSTAKLGWAVDVLEKKLTDDGAVKEDPEREARARTSTATNRPQAVPTPASEQSIVTKPDEIRVLLNTGKQHPSKRIQNATNRAFDAIDRVRSLLREDQEKNAEKRKADQAKARQREEVERLKRELAEAQAKLRATKRPSSNPGRTGTAPTGLVTTADLEQHGVTSKAVRAWAHENDVECPDARRLPSRVFEAWKTAHPEAGGREDDVA